MDLEGLPLVADVPGMPADLKAGMAKVYAFPLARHRDVVMDLVRIFMRTDPGAQRAAAFRVQYLAPLVEPRRRLGLTQDELDDEIWALEEAMVTILRQHLDQAGSAA